jgi:hypothetical protein
MIATTLTQAPVISEADLVALLSSLRGSKFLTITSRTDARLKKTGNPYGTVYKVSKVNICVNFQYEAGVRRRLEKEGKNPDDFVRGESWHTAVKSEDGFLTPLCSHKQTGAVYLRCQRLATIGEPVYFTQDGVEVTREEIAEWLPKQSEYANQGLEAPLIFLTYALSSIVEVVAEGETYTVQ